MVQKSAFDAGDFDGDAPVGLVAGDVGGGGLVAAIGDCQLAFATTFEGDSDVVCAASCDVVTDGFSPRGGEGVVGACIADRVGVTDDVDFLDTAELIAYLVEQLVKGAQTLVGQPCTVRAVEGEEGVKGQLQSLSVNLSWNGRCRGCGFNAFGGILDAADGVHLKSCRGQLFECQLFRDGHQDNGFAVLASDTDVLVFAAHGGHLGDAVKAIFVGALLDVQVPQAQLGGAGFDANEAVTTRDQGNVVTAVDVNAGGTLACAVQGAVKEDATLSGGDRIAGQAEGISQGVNFADFAGRCLRSWSRV